MKRIRTWLNNRRIQFKAFPGMHFRWAAWWTMFLVNMHSVWGLYQMGQIELAAIVLGSTILILYGLKIINTMWDNEDCMRVTKTLLKSLREQIEKEQGDVETLKRQRDALRAHLREMETRSTPPNISLH